MTNLQKLELKRSEIKQKLNKFSELSDEEFTEEKRSEFEACKKDLDSVETRYQAALLADSQEEKTVESTGEGKEIRTLLDKASLGAYLRSAGDGVNIGGAERELNQALQVDTNILPFEMLEERVDAPTTTTQLDGGTTQRPILQRLFGKDIFDFLGVRIDSVPTGMTEWPLLSGGGAVPAMKAESASAGDSVASTFTTQTLKPKRLTSKYIYSVEMAAQVKDLESVLRRDLQDSVKNEMCKMLLTGDGTGVNITGFNTRLNAPNPAPTAVAEFDDFAGAPSMKVDGIHASMESEVKLLVGLESYRLACRVHNQGSGESASEALRRRSGGFKATNYIAAAAANVQNGNLLHAGTDTMRGDSIAAMWSGGISLVRDLYSNASTGQVILTWISLWDCYTAFRADAYDRVSFKVS